MFTLFMTSQYLVGLCDVRTIPWSLGAYCAATLRILAHGNAKVKAKIVGQGGIPTLLKLCNPELVSDDTGDLKLLVIEGVHGIRPLVTFDVMSNSPYVSQGNTRQFGERI